MPSLACKACVKPASATVEFKKSQSNATQSKACDDPIEHVAERRTEQQRHEETFSCLLLHPASEHKARLMWRMRRGCRRASSNFPSFTTPRVHCMGIFCILPRKAAQRLKPARASPLDIHSLTASRLPCPSHLRPRPRPRRRHALVQQDQATPPALYPHVHPWRPW